MPLAPGTRLGPYEIVSTLGAGGMGEVYRARDPRLGRTVAVKISNEQFSARFEREARASAQLNHPYICALYDVGPNYLVMELVEGETLAARLEKGPLSLDQTLRYGAQLAEALGAAHAKGVVHRDLKPGNIMVTKSGVKVLDFGLAKLHSQPGETLTASHAVMGTPAYMAPEQLEGKECDGRADIFALGLVLYEMATGKRVLVAHGQSPSMDGLSPQFAHVVDRCLAREPESRWQSASDVKAELEWAGKVQPAIAPAASSKTTPRWMWPAAAVLCVGLIAASLWLTRRDTLPSETPSQFTLSFEDQMAGGQAVGVPELSPDGRHVVFVGGSVGAPTTSLWIRALDAVESKPLAGTEGGREPVWSPDSRWIAFYVEGKVKKISPSGGSSQTIADVSGFQDAAWGPHGDIIFRTGNRTSLFRIRETGGPPDQITKLDQSLTENSHRGPVFLPGRRTFLFTSRCGQRENNALYVGSLDSPTVKRLMPVQSTVRYVRSGNSGLELDTILYYRDGGLVARRFNPDTEELSGDPVPVVDKVGYSATGLGLDFNVSSDGRVALLRLFGAGQTRFTWFDRSGERTGTLGEPENYLQPRISPDGSRVAFTRPDVQTGNRDVWFIEIARAVPSRLTTNVANDWFPVWSPDGRQLLFGSDRGGGTTMRAFLKKALDAASEESPFSDANSPYDWSRDGKWIAHGTADVMVAPAIDPAKRFAFLATPFNEGDPRFSPDGKWMAYVSNETGRYEVYVRPFAGGPAAAEGKIQISNSGGDFPVWRPDGQELYYMSADFTLYAVNTTALGRSTTPLPSRLFRACPGTLPVESPMRDAAYAYNYDTHDGNQFLVNCAVEPPGRFVVLLNWPLTRN